MLTCRGCGLDLSSLSAAAQQLHVEACDDAQQRAEEAVHCAVCGRDVTHFSLARRAQHVNRCLDESTAQSVTEARTGAVGGSASTAAALDEVLRSFALNADAFECFVCGKALGRPNRATRVRHLKQCAMKHSVSRDQLVALMHACATRSDAESAVDTDLLHPGRKRREGPEPASEAGKRIAAFIRAHRVAGGLARPPGSPVPLNDAARDVPVVSAVPAAVAGAAVAAAAGPSSSSSSSVAAVAAATARAPPSYGAARRGSGDDDDAVMLMLAEAASLAQLHAELPSPTRVRDELRTLGAVVLSSAAIDVAAPALAPSALSSSVTARRARQQADGAPGVLPGAAGADVHGAVACTDAAVCVEPLEPLREQHASAPVQENGVRAADTLVARMPEARLRRSLWRLDRDGTWPATLAGTPLRAGNKQSDDVLALQSKENVGTLDRAVARGSSVRIDHGTSPCSHSHGPRIVDMARDVDALFDSLCNQGDVLLQVPGEQNAQTADEQYRQCCQAAASLMSSVHDALARSAALLEARHAGWQCPVGGFAVHALAQDCVPTWQFALADAVASLSGAAVDGSAAASPHAQLQARGELEAHAAAARLPTAPRAASPRRQSPSPPSSSGADDVDDSLVRAGAPALDARCQSSPASLSQASQPLVDVSNERTPPPALPSQQVGVRGRATARGQSAPPSLPSTPLREGVLSNESGSGRGDVLRFPHIIAPSQLNARSAGDDAALPEPAALEQLPADQLRSLMSRFALRPGARSYMLEQLRNIWAAQQAARSSQAPQRRPRPPVARRRRPKAAGANVAAPDDGALPPFVSASQPELGRGVRSASIGASERVGASSQVSASGDAAPRVVAMVGALRSSEELYARTLLFEPVAVSDVQCAMRSAGVRVSQRVLVDFCRAQGVLLAPMPAST